MPELTVMKETDEENKDSIKDSVINDVPLKWKTESNEETTEEEEFDERFLRKEMKLPPGFLKDLENDLDVNEEKSNDTIKDVADVLMHENWNKFKERSLRAAKGMYLSNRYLAIDFVNKLELVTRIIFRFHENSRTYHR